MPDAGQLDDLPDVFDLIGQHGYSNAAAPLPMPAWPPPPDALSHDDEDAMLAAIFDLEGATQWSMRFAICCARCSLEFRCM